MIKRLLIIALLTGIGHLTTLLSLKFISKNIDNDLIAMVGEFDSLSLLIISIVAFGLQLSSTRELAILDDWKTEYYNTQSARFTLSLFLIILGFTGFIYTKNYMFFIAPICALNGDYALYGRGKPIAGACIAFVRILIPSLTLVICSIYFKESLVFYYCISLVVAYLFAGIAVSYTLKVNYFVRPKLQHLKKYIDNINIGIASFSLFFVGIGIINVMSYFYNNETIAVVYIALKLYMIFKGVRRIIVQSFFKELKDISMAIKVDYFAMIAGVVFLATLLCFPKVIIPLLFDEKYSSYLSTFILLGVAGFISSFTTSSGTRLLLKKQDKEYSRNIIIAALTSITSGIVFWFLMGNFPFLIAISVLLGEIIISVLNAISLNEKGYFGNRLKLLIPIVLTSLTFALIHYLFGESLFMLIVAIFSFACFMLFFAHKKMKHELF